MVRLVTLTERIAQVCQHQLRFLLHVRSIVSWLYLMLFLRYSMSKNVVTLKSESRDHSSHWKWYHSI